MIPTTIKRMKTFQMNLYLCVVRYLLQICCSDCSCWECLINVADVAVVAIFCAVAERTPAAHEKISVLSIEGLVNSNASSNSSSGKFNPPSAI